MHANAYTRTHARTHTITEQAYIQVEATNLGTITKVITVCIYTSITNNYMYVLFYFWLITVCIYTSITNNYMYVLFYFWL